MAKKWALRKRGERLEMIVGPMFAGKSRELLRRLETFDYADVRYLIFKPAIDTRDGEYVKSRSGEAKKAILVNRPEDVLLKIEEINDDEIDVIAIDEAQLFVGEQAKELIETVEVLVSSGYCVLVAGLDKDFRGEPFGAIPELMCQADKITKMYSVCKVCGAEAGFSQRIIGDKPAHYNSDLVMIEVKDTYEPRCRWCFKIPGKKKSDVSKRFEETKKKHKEEIEEKIEEKIDTKPEEKGQTI